MDLSRRWIETLAQPSGSYNSCRFEMLLHHLPLSIAGRMVIHVKRVSYIEPLSILYRSEYGLSRAFSKKKEFSDILRACNTLRKRIAPGHPPPPENTSNRRRIKQLRSRRKLHRSDFPPLPPPESGEHCRQFSAAVTESPRGTNPAHRVVSKIWRMRCSVWRGDSTAIRELKRSITRNCAMVESIAPSRRRCSSAVVGSTQAALSASGECR